jgi:hypothetical protein
MKRVTHFTVLCLVLWLIPISLAVAKGSADKISISGPGLAKPIEITDQQILQQYSPWDDNYLDVQKGALKSVPDSDRIYEVLLYAKDDNGQLQVRYAFRYAPGLPGYIYVPGSGDAWYEVNIGTISRGSTIEGQWFYASKAWGALMQQLLGNNGIAITASQPQPIYTILPPQFIWLGLGGVIVLACILFWFFRSKSPGY